PHAALGVLAAITGSHSTSGGSCHVMWLPCPKPWRLIVAPSRSRAARQAHGLIPYPIRVFSRSLTFCGPFFRVSRRTSAAASTILRDCEVRGVVSRSSAVASLVPSHWTFTMSWRAGSTSVAGRLVDDVEYRRAPRLAQRFSFVGARTCA